MAFQENSVNGVVFMTSTLIPVTHGFSTRLGGVSEGYLSSLNLGSNRGDDMERVLENYRRLGAAVGVDVERMAFTKQVHGNTVRRVTEADEHIMGTDVPYTADGLVTDVPGLPLICFTADCVPVLLCDPEAGVIGAVHCGWRSSVSDILGNAVREMSVLGAAPERIRAAIGPAIGYCCFEVGEEVVDAARDWLGGAVDGLWRKHPEREEKYFLDLRGANARRLVQLGLAGASIDISDECTYCRHDKYWSHRYTQGKRGNQGAVIQLR